MWEAEEDEEKNGIADVKEDLKNKNVDIERAMDRTDTGQTEVEAFRVASSSARFFSKLKKTRFYVFLKWHVKKT